MSTTRFGWSTLLEILRYKKSRVSAEQNSVTLVNGVTRQEMQIMVIVPILAIQMQTVIDVLNVSLEYEKVKNKSHIQISLKYMRVYIDNETMKCTCNYFENKYLPHI